MPTKIHNSGWQDTIAAWVLIAAFTALWLMLGRGVLDQGRAHDFLSFYTGGYMVASGRAADLYHPAAQLEVQRALAPANTQLAPFIRPPFYALLLAPLGWLPFRTAFVCWILLQIGLLIACWAWAWRRFGAPAVVFGCMSLPAALGIAHGQDGPVFLAALIGSFLLTEKGSDFLGGAVLGLMLIKFHLSPLWPIAFVLQRRWRTLAGFGMMAALAAGASLALIGVGGVRAYTALLQDRDLQWLSPSPEFMISFQGLAANLGIESLTAQAAIVVGIAILFLMAMRRAPLWRLYAASTVASLLLTPHVYGYDAAMLLLGLWLTVFYTTRWTAKIAALWLLTPLPFAFTLADKPWAAISSLSLLALLLALAGDFGMKTSPQ